VFFVLPSVPPATTLRWRFLPEQPLPASPAHLLAGRKVLEPDHVLPSFDLLGRIVLATIGRSAGWILGHGLLGVV
jgi:hypothetical protein